MKRILLTGLMLAAGVGFGSEAAEAQAPRLGYINSQRIMAQAPGTSEAQQAFEADMQRYQQELEQLESELETLQQNMERQQATLSQQQRQQRQQEMQEKFMAYQSRRTELEQTAQRRQQELVEPIMARISEVIEQMRRDDGYAMIFDAAAGAIITADPALDLTERVLERLRTAPAR